MKKIVYRIKEQGKGEVMEIAVEGYQSPTPGLAIQFHKNRWGITHLKSGLTLQYIFLKRRKDAVACAEALSQLGDWTRSVEEIRVTVDIWAVRQAYFDNGGEYILSSSLFEKSQSGVPTSSKGDPERKSLQCVN